MFIRESRVIQEIASICLNFLKLRKTRSTNLSQISYWFEEYGTSEGPEGIQTDSTLV